MSETELTEQKPPAPLNPIGATRIDIEGMREKARRQLARILVFILAGVILLGFLGAGAIVAQESWLPTPAPDARLTGEVDLLLRLMELVFTPMVALVGGALGFYFAAKRK